MSDNVQIRCPQCEGNGDCPEPRWFDHPNQFQHVKCWVCNGYGVLVATELKAVTDVRPLLDGEGVLKCHGRPER